MCNSRGVSFICCHEFPAILYNVHLAPFETDPLDELMNGPIREKLGIIPTNVTWGGKYLCTVLAIKYLK